MELDWFAICVWVAVCNAANIYLIFNRLRTYSWQMKDMKSITRWCQAIAWVPVGTVIVAVSQIH